MPLRCVSTLRLHMATYNHEMVHSGAETLNDQLSGTAVAIAGKSGLVRAAFVSSDGTNTATLKGRASGKEIIPGGSHAAQMTLADMGQGLIAQYIYEGFVNPGEELDLQVIAAAASTSLVSVRTE